MSATTVNWSPTRPLVGVLGGMGPESATYFLQRVIARTQAHTDQDHLDLILLQHSSMPDRSAHLLDPSAPSPAPAIERDLHTCATLGAAFAVLVCNTAHRFVPTHPALPVLSMLDVAAQQCAAQVVAPADPTVIVLGTTGTVTSSLYAPALHAHGLRCVRGPGPLQRDVMTFIYDVVKPGRLDRYRDIVELIDRAQQHADLVLLACTELSAAYGYLGMSREPVSDALESLVEATIIRAGAPLTDQSWSASGKTAPI